MTGGNGQLDFNLLHIKHNTLVVKNSEKYVQEYVEESGGSGPHK